MKEDPKKQKGMGRRQVLPILGGGLLLPFLPAEARAASGPQPSEEEYQTLLKPDGTTVRVRVSSLKNSRVIREKLSNSELREWLDKNGDLNQ